MSEKASFLSVPFHFYRQIAGLSFVLAGYCIAAPPAIADEPEQPPPKQVIGPTTEVLALDGKLTFAARVDTGAATTSVHVDKVVIEDESPKKSENVGKTVRFLIGNHNGQQEWVVRKIADVGVVKTSERQEERYKVKMTLKCNDVKKQVSVTLNDRSNMQYPLLLGRNFLQNDFLVDVGLTR